MPIFDASGPHSIQNVMNHLNKIGYPTITLTSCGFDGGRILFTSKHQEQCISQNNYGGRAT